MRIAQGIVCPASLGLLALLVGMAGCAGDSWTLKRVDRWPWKADRDTVTSVFLQPTAGLVGYERGKEGLLLYRISDRRLVFDFNGGRPSTVILNGDGDGVIYYRSGFDPQYFRFPDETPFRFFGNLHWALPRPRHGGYVLGTRHGIFFASKGDESEEGVAFQFEKIGSDFSPGNSQICPFALHPDEKWIVSWQHAEKTSSAIVSDLTTGETVATLDTVSGDGSLVHGAFSPDGTRFAVARPDGRLRIWSVKTWEVLADIHLFDPQGEEDQTAPVVAFAPWGDLLAVALESRREVVLLDLVDEERLGVLETRVGKLKALGFTEGGRFLRVVGLKGMETWGDVAGSWLQHEKERIIRTAHALDRERYHKIEKLSRPCGEFETNAMYEKRLQRVAYERNRIERDYRKRKKLAKKEILGRIAAFQTATRHPADLTTEIGRYHPNSQRFPVEILETGQVQNVDVSLSAARDFKARATEGQLKATGRRFLSSAKERWVYVDLVLTDAVSGKEYPVGGDIRGDLLKQPPSKLVFSQDVYFNDKTGNSDGVLDAGETGKLFVRLRNEGKGSAPDVVVHADISGDPLIHIQHPPGHFDVGALGPGDETRLYLEMSGEELLPDGLILVKLRAEDALNFSASPSVFRLSTRKLPHPEMVLAEYWINDSVGEYAMGNGNKNVEPNEGIELNLLVRNDGPGRAVDVVATLYTEVGEVILSKSREEVGDLASGKKRTLSMHFKVPAGYGGPNKLPFRLVLTDARDRFTRIHTVTLPMGEYIPRVGVLTHRSGRDGFEAITPVDVPPETARPIARPGSTALVVGISRYQPKPMPEVIGARRDAQAMEGYLKSMGFDSITTLLDQDATGTRIRNAIARALSGLGPEGDFLLFFSGHGTTDALKEAYLVPYDAVTDDLPGTSLGIRDLVQQIGRTRARNRVVIVDACFAAGLGEDRPMVNHRSVETGEVALLTATGPGQLSNPLKGKGHGLFTYYLLDGLHGLADDLGDRDGTVTLGEIYDYVSQIVPKEAKRIRPQPLQEPLYIGPTQGRAFEMMRLR